MPNYCIWKSLLDIKGLTIHSVRGEQVRKNQKVIEPKIILFTDGKTYIELEDQDYYTYHDFSFTAKEFNIRESEEVWNQYLDYPEANTA